VLPTSDVLPEAAWTPNRDYAFGDKIQLRCKQGYSVRINFPGINRAGGACQKLFVDECLSIGRFRTSFEEACQRIQCPAPAMTGVVKVPASDPVSYGTVVSQTCLTGYEAVNIAGAYITSLPYESICQDTCDMSHPLKCIYSECGFYADFDYSEGVEPVEPITKYGDQLQITCKPNFMLDDRLPCITALQTAADNCIPIRYHRKTSRFFSIGLLSYVYVSFDTCGRGMEVAFANAVVLGSTSFAPPTNVRLPASYPVTGAYGSVTVRVPAGGWPAEEVGTGLTITAIEIRSDQRPTGLKSLVCKYIHMYVYVCA